VTVAEKKQNGNPQFMFFVLGGAIIGACFGYPIAGGFVGLALLLVWATWEAIVLHRKRRKALAEDARLAAESEAERAAFDADEPVDVTDADDAEEIEEVDA